MSDQYPETELLFLRLVKVTLFKTLYYICRLLMLIFYLQCNRLCLIGLSVLVPTGDLEQTRYIH